MTPARHDTAGQPPLISAEGLLYRQGQRVLLDHVSLAVGQGEILTVVGPNGAGKTTLVRMLLGALRPHGGVVRRAAGLRIGYVPQRLHLDPLLPLTVGRFLALSRGRPGKAAIHGALGELHAEHLTTRSMHQLSGGEFQRVLLARAMLGRPNLLLLDEPLQGVDVGGQVELYRHIATLRASLDCGVLLISHDLHLVMAGTDRVICLNGHVCCSGAPDKVIRDPEYLALFGGAAPSELALYGHHHDHIHDHAPEGADGPGHDGHAHHHAGGEAP